MIYTWNLNPVALSIFGLDIRWYGLAYVTGFFALQYGGYWIQKQTLNKPFSKEVFENFVFGSFLSGVLGGRLGLFLFYSPQTFWTDPLEIFKVWNGGMSFHGALLGLALFVFFWCRKHKVSFLALSDIMTIPASATLILGRIANFINGELVGRPTDQTWGVIFPHVDALMRHPSQLYESGKNLLLCLILITLFRMGYGKQTGILTAVFLGGYGTMRFGIEFFREPDGNVFGFSMGQALSGTMVVLALGIVFYKTLLLSKKQA